MAIDETPAAVGQDTFLCPGCGEEEFPDEVGTVVCDFCGAKIETEPADV